MTRCLRSATLLFLVLGVAAPCRAQFSMEAIRKGKEATVLIETEDGEGGTGTAFCIDPGGLFVTNAHVVESGSTFKLIVSSGLPGQSVYTARVLSLNRQSDLALLQVAADRQLTALELGREDDLVETLELVAFGYPFGKFLSGGKGYPSVSVNLGRITSLRMPDGKLSSIQLDVVLNPGNSGGPVLNKDGKVIGIVQKGVKGAGINFAIPVGRLAEMLETPLVLFDPAPIAFRDRHKPIDWTIKVLRGGRPDAESEVVLTVATGAAEPRAVPVELAAQKGGVFRAHLVPISPDVAAATQILSVSATFTGGQLNGKVADRAIKVGAREVRLSQLSQVRLGPQPAATLTAGGELAGHATGLEDVRLDLGGASVAVDLGRAERIEIQPPPAESFALRCIVSVRKGAKELATVEKTIEIGDGDGRMAGTGPGGTLSIKPSAMSDEKRVIKLPGTVSDVAVGAGGRFLLLTLKDVKKLAVFDVNAAKVVRLLSLPSEDALVAAGAAKFVILSPSHSVLQRWSLATLEKERTVVAGADATFTALAMGSSSAGPIMFFCVTEGRQHPIGSAGFGFLDLETLKPLKLDRSTSYFMGNRQGNNAGSTILLSSPHFGGGNERVQLRAAPGGELFAAWSTTHSPRGMLSFVWRSKGSVEMHYDHNDVGHILPGGDGRTLYTGSGGLFNEDLKPSRLGMSAKGFFVPSTDPNYFLGLDKQRASLYVTGNSSPLLVVNGLAELDDSSSRNRQSDMIADKRVVFIPPADLLVTFPLSQDQVVLRRLNVMESLRKSDIDYLFVSSMPVRKATRGAAYEYPLSVQSRRGGLKYDLTSGPEGMKVSPAGKITWDVPGDIEGDDVTVVVTIKDSSNQEIFHTFSIRLR
jgi:serine protease Do